VKIAFVNQPIDTILPPYQSSVGACTYGAACSLSKSCDIIVYGIRNRHKDFPDDFREQNGHFRFFGALSERLAVRAKKIGSELFPLSAPASSSKWFYRTLGRRAASASRPRLQPR
jgi:hypothetical protein